MNPPSVRLGSLHQAYLYATGALLVMSGALWLLFHYFVRMPGEFGEQAHALEPWWLVIHGLSAAAFLIGFGSVLPGHVRRAWKGRRNRLSGTAFFAGLVILVLSGYLLYYTGEESARAVLSLLHWIVGLAIPAAMGWHVWRGHAWRRIRSEGELVEEARESPPIRLVRKP